MPINPEVTFAWRVGKDPTELGRAFDKFNKAAIREIATMVNDAAEMLIETIREEWSGYYPPASTSGYPPARRTDNLDTAVGNSRLYGRDRLGRFSSIGDRENTISVTLVIDTVNRGLGMVKGKKPRNYAAYLEEGTTRMEARPFVVPAIDRVERAFPKLVGKVKINLSSERYQ